MQYGLSDEQVNVSGRKSLAYVVQFLLNQRVAATIATLPAVQSMVARRMD
jgi:hypothetical protein